MKFLELKKNQAKFSPHFFRAIIALVEIAMCLCVLFLPTINKGLFDTIFRVVRRVILRVCKWLWYSVWGSCNEISFKQKYSEIDNFRNIWIKSCYSPYCTCFSEKCRQRAYTSHLDFNGGDDRVEFVVKWYILERQMNLALMPKHGMYIEVL